MSDNLNEVVEKFVNRWEQLNRVPDLRDAQRIADPAVDDLSRVPAAKIERYGNFIVYPSPSFKGWFDVREDGGSTIVSFAGETAHVKAVLFAKRAAKLETE